MSFTYLASPYSHPDPAVRLRRFDEVCLVASRLMGAGEAIFCPIAHSHPIDSAESLPQTTGFWMAQDIPILRHAAKVKVLMLAGWNTSNGIAAELKTAALLNIPIEYIAHESSYLAPPLTAHEGIYEEERE